MSRQHDDREDTKTRRKNASRPSRLRGYILLVAVIVLAAFFRLWQLGEMPPALYHDEAYNGLDALSLTQGKTFPQFYEGWELYAADAHANRAPAPTRFPIFFEGNYGREPVHIYLMALAVKLLGATPAAIRIVPALAGVLAVFTTYLAAKKLTIVNCQLSIVNYSPLFAAFALAILFPAVHFSRFGLRAMLFVPVETLAVYFFWRGINGRSLPSFTFAGFLLGFGLYIYAAARLFPLLFVLFVVFWFWREKTAVLALKKHLLIMIGAAGLTAVPLLIFFARYPYFFGFRIAYVANKGLGTVEGKPWITWFNNVGRVFRGLFWQGETHLRHNLPARPYLDPIQAAFFIIGLIRAAARWLDLRYAFLLLWLGVMLLPTILSGDAPHFGRMTGAAPVIAIFIGLGLDWLWRRARWGAIWRTAVALLIAASAAITYRDYFVRYAAHPDLPRDFYADEWAMGQYAAAQPPETAIYLTPGQEELATIYYALGDPDRLQNYDGGQSAVPAGRPFQPILYLIRPSDEAALRRLTTQFPDGELGGEQNNFIPFRVPADAPRIDAEQLTDDVEFNGRIALRGYTVAQDEEQLELTLVWQAIAPDGGAYTAFVHLLDSDGNLIAQKDRPPAGYPTADWQPGEIVIDRYIVPLPPDFPAGTYRLQTGFYESMTLEPVGETAVLTDFIH